MEIIANKNRLWTKKGLCDFWKNITEVIRESMQNTDNGIISKSVMLARLIYKPKKSLETERKSNFRIDSGRVWRGNIQELVDVLKKNHR